MKKEECIRRYGEAEWERKLEYGREWLNKNSERKKETNKRWQVENRDRYLEYNRQWNVANPDRCVKAVKRWKERNPEKVIAFNRRYSSTGIPHEKRLVRGEHYRYWTPYKQIIAPDSQMHHEWLPGTADYRGMALVEKDQHMHGYVDVIQILEGKITLFTEEEIRIRDS